MNKDRKYIQVITNSDTFNKVHYIANFYSRSIKGQMRWLINYSITKFEKNYGPIEIDSKDD